MSTLVANNSLLDALLQSPRLSLYAQRIDQLLAEEAQRHTTFWETMREDQKVEFINGEIVVHSPVKLRRRTVAKYLVLLDPEAKVVEQYQLAGDVYALAVKAQTDA